MFCETGTKLKGLFILREEGLSRINSITAQNRHLDGRSLGFGFDLILKAKFPSLSGFECHHLEHRTRPALLGYCEN